MTVGSATFAEELWPGIKAHWGDAYKDYPVMFKKVFTVEKSDKRFEKHQQITGLPLASVKDEGATVEYADPEEGHQKEYVNVTYALGSSVTREMYEDDQYGVIRRIPKYLARSMRHTEEVTAFNIFNNGFTTENSADGQTIFNTAHVLVNGDTLANRPDTPADLSQTSYQNGVLTIRGWTDEKGLRTFVEPKKLLTSDQESFTGEVILGSQYKTGGEDNDINPVYGHVEFCWTPYLTDEDAWFILTDIDEGFMFFQRRAAEIDRDNEFDTQNLKFLTTERWSVGCTDWRGGYGSTGAT